MAGVVALLAPASALAKSKPPTLPVAGDVVVAGGVDASGNALSSAEFYSAKRHKFFVTGSMNTARGGLQTQWFTGEPEGFTVGGVAAGGFTGTAAFSGGTLTFDIVTLRTVEGYDPSTGTFTVSPQQMAVGRAFSSSIAFPSTLSNAAFLASHVLVWSGLCNSTALDCNTASILHPENPVEVTATSSVQAARMLGQLTFLNNNTVLATGGIGDLNGGTLSSAEVFDPSNETSATVSAPMSSARMGHTATLLRDGTVLIVGGAANSGGTLTALDTAEIYDPTAQTFTPIAATLNQPRVNHTATMLPNGKVLIAGGFDGNATVRLTGTSSGVTGTLAMTSGEILNTAEIYDPAAKTFTCVKGLFKKTGLCKPSMKSSRAFQVATALSDGEVLLTGGIGAPKGKGSPGVLFTAERFHGANFQKTGNMTQARVLHGATLVLP